MAATTWHSGLPEEDWDKKQTELQAHFLQTRAWATFQDALGRRIFYASGSGWSWLAVLEHTKLGSRLYCPYGPSARSKKQLQSALAALVDCAQSQHATYVRIEPTGLKSTADYRELGLHRARRNIQPELTWVKRLDLPEDELIAEMTATNRNLHRTAAKKGLSFQTSSNPADIKIFLAMMHEVAAKNSIQIHPDSYYQTMAETLMPLGALKLYIAKHDGKPVATSLVFDSPTTRYYAHAASRFEARKLHPGTPLVSHMILAAKQQGQQWFDFYGIAPPDQPNHRWAGFTRFKQSFGGEMRHFSGTWELPVQKLPYSLYRMLGKFVK